MAQKGKGKNNTKPSKEKDVIVEISSQEQNEEAKDTQSEEVKSTKKEKKDNKKQVSLKKYEALEKQADEFKQSSEEMKDKYYRMAAEFDNFKKRTHKEIEQIHKYAGEIVLKEIIPVFEDLSRALANETSEETADNSGLSMIFKKFEKTLKDLGVEPIKSLGEAFDPDLHHALMVREEEGVDPDMVVEEFEKGYKFKDKILKHAKVVVSK